MSANTACGRVRGRPGPCRWTRIWSSSGDSCGLSPSWPRDEAYADWQAPAVDGEEQFGAQPAAGPSEAFAAHLEGLETELVRIPHFPGASSVLLRPDDGGVNGDGPRRARAQLPQDGVDDLPVITPSPAACVGRQQRFDDRPRLIRQLATPTTVAGLTNANLIKSRHAATDLQDGP